MIVGYQGRPVGTHPPPRSCNCDVSPCRHDFERVGPTLGPDLPVWEVKALGRIRKVPAQSLKVAEHIARARSLSGKWNSTFLFTSRIEDPRFHLKNNQ